MSVRKLRVIGVEESSIPGSVRVTLIIPDSGLTVNIREDENNPVFLGDEYLLVRLGPKEEN